MSPLIFSLILVTAAGSASRTHSSWAIVPGAVSRWRRLFATDRARPSGTADGVNPLIATASQADVFATRA